MRAGLVVWTAMFAGLLVATSLRPGLAQTVGGGGRAALAMTVRTPAPEALDLVLDELELQWRGGAGPGAGQARSAVATGTAILQKAEPGRTLFAARGATTGPELGAAARDLEAQNPGADVYLVLYETGKPHTDATRRLLGREVAVLLDRAGADATLRGLAAFQPTPVAGVADAYVLVATDPFAAVTLAEQVGSMPGVVHAYPLLRKRQVLR